MERSSTKLSHAQACRVYKFYSTSVQSVTSALSIFRRFLNCQRKRILIGRFALLLSVIAQGLDVRLAGTVSSPAKFCSTNWRCSRTVLEHLELF